MVHVCWPKFVVLFVYTPTLLNMPVLLSSAAKLVAAAKLFSNKPILRLQRTRAETRGDEQEIDNRSFGHKR
jgi:hypothetical protein